MQQHANGSTDGTELATFADSRAFRFTCLLTNGETSIQIKKDSIEELVIEDTAVNWWSQGYIDIRNPRGVLERTLVNMQENMSSTLKNNTSTYMFRNDARDFLFFSMLPNLFGDGDTPQNIDDSFYKMRYQFAIYSVKDITKDDTDENKIKRLYFADWRYVLMTVQNSNFTTTTSLSGAVAHMSDTDREIPTGDAIKSLLNESLPDEQQFADNWQPGPNQVDFMSSTNSTVLDDLYELLDNHLSDDVTGNQPCILHLDRYTNVWSLVPVATFFDNATTRDIKGTSVSYIPGIYQSEKFVIGRDVGYEERDLINPNAKIRVPQQQSLYFNYSYGQSSTINSYRYIEMHGDVNQKSVATRPVHQYDTVDKKFKINMASATAKSLVNHLKQTVLTNMQVADYVKEDVPLGINVDGDRFANITAAHMYTNSDDFYGVLRNSRNKAIMELLFEGNAIEFTVPGETTRRSCRFISVANNITSSGLHGKHDDKVEGQYFVTGVIHRIKNNTYTNKIVGTKLYNYDNQFESDRAIYNKQNNNDKQD